MWDTTTGKCVNTLKDREKGHWGVDTPTHYVSRARVRRRSESRLAPKERTGRASRERDGGLLSRRVDSDSSARGS